MPVMGCPIRPRLGGPSLDSGQQFNGHSWYAPHCGEPPVCQECAELRLGVPGMCLGVAGERAGKRCKWLIIKPLERATLRKDLVRKVDWRPILLKNY
jgi:hypothetical protein